MSFTTLTQPEIEEKILRDILNVLPDAYVGIDSDYAVRAAAMANGIEGLYQYQAWIVRQIFPDTADADIMEAHANLHNIVRKVGNLATGSIDFAGTPGSAVPVATQVKNTDGLMFLTTAAGVIDGAGHATIAAQAAAAGIAYNTPNGILLQLIAAPIGVNSQAVINTMLAGTDVESNASLLTRLLSVLRDPPASGNPADFKRWALEVAGCDGAYVYPLRRGLGTSDVIITSAGGLPSLQLINAVQSYIDDKRACGLNTLLVLAPTVITQNYSIEVKLTGVSLSDATASINAAINNYYNSIAPGTAVIKSQIEALISDILGVTDRNVISPAGNVTPTVNETTCEWCRKGTVNVSLMA